MFAGGLMQIDSGPTGIVYGVNSGHNIYCRKGISASNPKGTSWKWIPGALNYISCGKFGCWGVNKNNYIYFRTRVTASECEGLNWVHIPGLLKQIEV